MVRVNHHRACDQTIFLVCVLMRGNTYLHIQMHSKLAQEINNMVKRFNPVMFLVKLISNVINCFLLYSLFIL